MVSLAHGRRASSAVNGDAKWQPHALVASIVALIGDADDALPRAPAWKT
jgi:hypothetical protein